MDDKPRLLPQLPRRDLLHLVNRYRAVHIHRGFVGLMPEEIFYPLRSKSSVNPFDFKKRATEWRNMWRFKFLLIPHLKRRTVLRPASPFVIEPGRRDIRMPEPLLDFGNIRNLFFEFFGKGVGGIQVTIDLLNLRLNEIWVILLRCRLRFI